jgi:hypothetical protein
MAIAHLEWSPGGGVNQEVRYKTPGDLSYTLYQTVSGSANSIDIPDLDSNIVYQFLIINKCLFGLQTPSDVTEQALVECPSLSVEQAALSLTVNFTHLGGDVSQYSVELYLVEMPTNILVESGTILTPSGSLSYTFTGLTADTYYEIKVIPQIGTDFENDTCTITQRTLGCAEDYTLAPDGSYCYKTEETSPTAPTGGTPDTTVVKKFQSYSTVGSYIYNFGFNVNGTGTANKITLSNSFWVNGDGSGADNPANLGPMNRCALWSTTTLSSQYIGFSVCIDLSVSNTYYIGMGGDNRCRIVIDSVVIVDQDPVALGAEFSYSTSSTFKLWHIYPVTLSSGPHIIELLGYNDGGVAAMGAEIYNNTPAEIIAATSYSDLNLVFSTKDYIGQPVQLGSNSLGYSCPSGYSLAACSTPYVCRRVLTTLPS